MEIIENTKQRIIILINGIEIDISANEDGVMCELSGKEGKITECSADF